MIRFHALLLVGAGALAASHVSGQTPPAGGPGDATADATRLPGDRPPPRGAPPGPPPGGANAPRPPEPGADAPAPALTLALEAAQDALAHCSAQGHKVSVAVIDSAGQPRVALSADGVAGGHIYTGVRKGLAAAAFGMPSSQIQSQVAGDASLAAKMMPNMAAVAGAVPLKSGGKVIGAIGVSGASSAQDEECARAGADKIQSRL